ncbi:MAG: lipopolysaccharide biosynthesis protein [Gammaproteobacteria bacterium]
MTTEALVPGRLARATATLFGGNLAMLLLQTLQFVLLARLLGVAEFGRVAAVNALIAIAIPLAGLGYGNVLLMRVSTDRTRARSDLGNSQAAIAVIGTVLVGVVTLVACGVYGAAANVWLVVTMAISELILVRSVMVLGQLFQALDRVEMTSALNTMTASCRVTAVVLMMVAGVHDALVWAMTSCAMMFLLVGVAHAVAVRAVGSPRLDVARLWADRTDALHFSLGTGAKSVYTELDKVFLARSATAGELGAYTAAYRLVVMAFLPVRSLLDASASQFYRRGAESLARSYAFAWKLLKVALPYGVACAALILAGAELVPHVLGASFDSATPILRSLAVLPLIQSIHYSFSDALTAAGLQRLRTQLQWFVAVIYAGLAAILVPRYGWQGAVAVCLGCELLLAVFVVAAIRNRVQREKNSV